MQIAIKLDDGIVAIWELSSAYKQMIPVIDSLSLSKKIELCAALHKSSTSLADIQKLLCSD